MKIARWELVWAHARTHAPTPRSVAAHAFVLGNASPLCLPVVAGDPGPFVSSGGSVRCEVCASAVSLASIDVAPVRALAIWTWTVRARELATRGTASSREGAERSALAALDAGAGAPVEFVGFREGGMAAQYARDLRANAGRTVPRPAQDGARAYRVDFEFDGASMRPRVVTGPIVRITDRRIFIEVSSRTTDQGATVQNTIGVDRIAFERGEEVRGWRRSPPTAAELARFTSGAPSGVPAWTRVLSLGWPCSPEEAHRAFRMAAKVNHPDVGGDEAAFRELVTAREEAIRFFAARGAS